jgi:hypothetical protein
MSGSHTKSMVEKIKLLDGYPSASGICHFKDHTYIIGDDASYILVTDADLNETGRIDLMGLHSGRIPKMLKPDLESITVININDKDVLLLTGSGSLSPVRNYCWLIDPVSKDKITYDLDTFYRRIKDMGLQVNIEGAATLPTGLVFGNRGNKNAPYNNLIFTSVDFWSTQSEADIRLSTIQTPSTNLIFSGISGLDYSTASGKLLITVSTEDTENSFNDGRIGKSYIWVVDDINGCKDVPKISPDRIIDLEEIDPRFHGHKIESIAIISESDSEWKLILASDDDLGGSVLFKLLLTK